MRLQETIHEWTTGGAARRLNIAVVILAMAGLAAWYQLAAFKNLSAIEGFDSAQLARNLADGRGYTTDFIRPFSVYLLHQHEVKRAIPISRPPEAPHPDLANAPLYPVLLAGALKLMPFPYPHVAGAAGDRAAGAYAPDRWVAGFNQLLFVLAVGLLFRLTSRLFEPRVGWLAVVVVAGTDLFWQFSLSGLPTVLAMLIVIGLADVLARGGVPPPSKLGPGPSRVDSPVRRFGLGLLAGVLTGLAGMTRYSLAWLIIPVVIYWASMPGGRRVAGIVGSVAGFLAMMAPWLARNVAVSGTLFGTAGFAVYEGTRVFPGFELQRTINADFSLVRASDFLIKLVTGLRDIVEHQLPQLSGHWVAAFFLVGLLIPYRTEVLNRLRIFVVTALLTLAVVQALGRTDLSKDSPVVNGENLLVVLAPLVLMFGVSLFQILADQLAARDPGSRWAVVGLLVVVGSAPLALRLARPESSALAFPPYNPALVQEKAGQIGERDWMMTDIPWAVAWYGARSSVWLSLRYKEPQPLQRPNDFAAVNRAGSKPLRALYLSNRWCRSVETWGLWSWIHRAERGDWERELSEWEAFVVGGAYAELEVPTGFPLKDAPFGLWPELFLMDSERPAGNAIKGE